MDHKQTPLACFFGFQNGKCMTFIGRDGYIDAHGPIRQIKQVLSQCNGYNTVEMIKRLCKNVPARLVDEILDEMASLGIVSDSKELYLQFHTDSANPTRFATNLSARQIAELESAHLLVTGSSSIDMAHPSAPAVVGIRERRSTRTFADKPISEILLAGLLRSMYGQTAGRSTPSAGGLYPLRVFIGTISKYQVIGREWHEYDPRQLKLFRTGLEVKYNDLYRALDARSVVDESSFVIFIAADLNRPAVKYGNRGYRFALIEAGHVAQNASLFCANHDLGILEFGGFDDRLASEMLGLKYPGEAVLLALFVGHPSDKKSGYLQQSGELAQLTMIVGKNKPVKSWSVQQLSYQGCEMPWFAGFAKLRDNSNAFSTGSTRTQASIKVLSEAYERTVSGELRIDLEIRATDISGSWLDPRLVFPHHKSVQGNRLQAFDENKTWQWVRGVRASGEEVLVPVDLVFYPLYRKQLGRRLCCETNSSGVAAHFNEKIAKTSALQELIERDAIMVTWFARKNVTAISQVDWPEEISARAGQWQKEGRAVKVLNLTMDSIPVVLVTIVSSKYPYFVSGASADFDWPSAISKAYNEAEFMLLSWIGTRPRKPNPKRIVSPKEHGVLFFRKDHLEQVDWLVNSPESDLPEVTSCNIVRQFDPVYVKLGNDEGAGLKVFRALSTKLLPIHFGYGLEPYGHSRLEMLGLRWCRKYPSFPHFFA